MRFSFARWQLLAAAVATGSSLVGWLEAAQPRTANGNAVVRATHQEPAEAPSVMRPGTSRPAPAAPPPVTRSPARVAPAPMPETVYQEEGVLDEHFHPAHNSYHGHPGHSFNEWDFNDSCLGRNCAPCSAGPIWVKADFILWWRDGLDLPALVTTAPDGTPQATAGEIGQPGTSTLFGGEREEYPVRPGGRLTAGWWCDSCETLGVEGRFFWVGDAEQHYTNSSAGSPILAIPFTEGATGVQDARLIGFPNTFGGNLDFSSSSEILGGDLYARMLWCRTNWGRIDLLGGYQYARLNEGLVMDSTVTDLVGGASNRLVDTFDTTNEFHGGLLGVNARLEHCCFFVDLLGKVALGNMNQTVEISGLSVSTVGNTVSTINNSGLFAQPTNVGTYSRSQFVAIPEFGANVGWHVTDCIDVSVGYTMIVFSGVSRPGDAIDTTVNTTQIGGALNGPARPGFEFVDSDLILHGLNMGVSFKW